MAVTTAASANTGRDVKFVMGRVVKDSREARHLGFLKLVLLFVPEYVMASTPEEQAAKMVDSLPEKTGKSMQQWLAHVGRSGI